MIVKERWCLNTAIRYTLGVTAGISEVIEGTDSDNLVSDKLRNFS